MIYQCVFFIKKYIVTIFGRSLNKKSPHPRPTLHPFPSNSDQKCWRWNAKYRQNHRYQRALKISPVGVLGQWSDKASGRALKRWHSLPGNHLKPVRPVFSASMKAERPFSTQGRFRQRGRVCAEFGRFWSTLAVLFANNRTRHECQTVWFLCSDWYETMTHTV